MAKENHLYRILFLTSIILLLLNDLFLKYAFHNSLTGKLSDFAGIFAFPYFWACIFPRKVKSIFIFTAFLFIFWKSEISQPLIDLAHNYGIGINRTVDYSDLISLLILPLSYMYWKSDVDICIKKAKLFTASIKGICIMSFIATTLPKETHAYNLKSDYKKVVETDFQTLKSGLPFYETNSDGYYMYYLDLPERNITIDTRIIVKEINDNQLLIKLDSILVYFKDSGRSPLAEQDKQYMDSLDISEIELLFEKEIERLLSEK